MLTNFGHRAGVTAIVIATFSLFAFESIVQSSFPDIIVNTTSDVADFGGAQQIADLPGPDGLVSLREAVIAANNTAGPQVIEFNIPTSDSGFNGTIFTIKPQSPHVSHLFDDGTTIDGTSQAIFTGDTNPMGPELVLDGSLSGGGPGIDIFQSSDNVIKGLVIHSFQQGAAIQFGFSPDDPARLPNNNKISGCYLGTDETGSVVKGNGLQGIAVNGSRNIIGGFRPGEGNLISGNNLAGVSLGSTTSETRMEGNLIGTDRTGTVPLGNNGFGIGVSGSNNLIGGTADGTRNIISGNTNNGVVIVEGAGNRVEGNFIGSDITGNNPLPNDGLGVQIAFDATANVLTRNRIAFNASDGIAVGFNAIRNLISENSIFSNGGLGIDLGNGGNDDFHGDGVTANDPDDVDTGPNDLMNFPVLTRAHAASGRLVVKGEIDTPNPGTVTIEFFANPVPTPGGDPSAHGEGAIFLGTTRPNPQGNFTATLPPVSVGTLITATATDAEGNTSEFAINIAASFP